MFTLRCAQALLIVLATIPSTISMSDKERCRSVNKCWSVNSFCSHNRQIYPMYKILEDALVSDKEQLFDLKQTMFPPYVNQDWNVDGVDIIPISCSVIIDSFQVCPNETISDNKPENLTIVEFVWTNSLLYALMPIEQLRGFDPDFTKQILDTLIHSYFASRQITLYFHIKQLPCLTTKDDIINALVALSSWIKAYAHAQSTPTDWDETLIGYISKHKGTYSKEPYTNELSTVYGIKIVLQVMFISINILLPMVLPCLGHRLQAKLHRLTLTKCITQNIWVAAFTATSFNIGYIIIAIRTYSHDLGVVYVDTTGLPLAVAKLIIVPVAFIIELIGAIYNVWKWPKLRTFNHKSKRCCKYTTLVFRAVATWQAYIFIHIILGMFAVPLCTYLLISPGLTMVTTGLFFGVLASFHGLILSVARINWCSKNPKLFFISIVLSIRMILIILVSCCTATLYYLAVTTGVNQSSSVGFLLSVLPVIPLSIALWFIKHKIFGKNNTTKGKYKMQPLGLHRSTSFDSTSSTSPLLTSEN